MSPDAACVAVEEGHPYAVAESRRTWWTVDRAKFWLYCGDGEYLLRSIYFVVVLMLSRDSS